MDYTKVKRLFFAFGIPDASSFPRLAWIPK